MENEKIINTDLQAETENTQMVISEESSMNIHKEIGLSHIPFKSYLSFEPLIRYLESEVEIKRAAEKMTDLPILKKIEEKFPELREPIKDPSILKGREDLVNILISCIIPPVSANKVLAKMSLPFSMDPFYMTPAFKKLYRQQKVEYHVNRSANLMYCATIVGACSLILNKFYGQDVNVDPPLSISIKEHDSNLTRHFKFEMNTDFIDILALKPPKPLDQQEINKLMSNIYDVDLWLQAFPPENYEFHGFTYGRLIDITEEESLSRLKFNLLKKDAIVTQENVDALEELVQTFLGMEDLQLGVTALDYPQERSVSHKYKIRFDFLSEVMPDLISPETENSIYEKAARFKEVLLVEDLTELNKKTPIEEALIKKGLRSIIVAPLFNKKDQVIGLLEIGSTRPYAMHSFVEVKFKDIIDMFSLAVERSREEIDSQIESIIREQFTDVHPSVEWRFIEASYNLLEKRASNRDKASMEPIVFNNVYPLYGQADIVNSSNHRNSGIQADLIDNLSKVRFVLEKCLTIVQYPLINQFIMQVDGLLDDLQEEFNSNDESRVVETLHLEIHPLLQYFRKKYPEMAAIISGYFDLLDPDLHVIYNKRKDYEDTVTSINSAIANYLETEEEKTQQVLPHYFAKYKTDGVEYDMYFGQSLLKNDTFSEMHLKNFRLWQLIHMVEITRKVKRMQSTLPVPLTTAQLIFAYTNPLSIRFRQDEKQFDVDGAYNVRYEILKKRIDKATVENSDERITQADKIAIIYLQEKDRLEYIEYLNYLKHDGYITDNIEDLKVGKLQGAQGLRALRVTVKYPDQPSA